jgi:hypothetical protein
MAKFKKNAEKIAPEKYDICISIDVVNGADTGKKSVINHTSPFLSIHSNNHHQNMAYNHFNYFTILCK